MNENPNEPARTVSRAALHHRVKEKCKWEKCDGWVPEQSCEIEQGHNHLVKLNPELTATLQGGGEGVQVLSPKGEELLDAQATQGIVPGIADAIFLAHGHHLVVDMERVLQQEAKSV